MITVDCFAVAVLIQDNIVGHLPKGKLGHCAKSISYFLKPERETHALS